MHTRDEGASKGLDGALDDAASRLALGRPWEPLASPPTRHRRFRVDAWPWRLLSLIVTAELIGWNWLMDRLRSLLPPRNRKALLANGAKEGISCLLSSNCGHVTGLCRDLGVESGM